MIVGAAEVGAICGPRPSDCGAGDPASGTVNIGGRATFINLSS